MMIQIDVRPKVELVHKSQVGQRGEENALSNRFTRTFVDNEKGEKANGIQTWHCRIMSLEIRWEC